MIHIYYYTILSLVAYPIGSQKAAQTRLPTEIRCLYITYTSISLYICLYYRTYYTHN